MKSVNVDDRRDVPDDETARNYLLGALDNLWQLNTEYLGCRADMERAWTLQNELRRTHGLEELNSVVRDDACAHFPVRERAVER